MEQLSEFVAKNTVAIEALQAVPNSLEMLMSKVDELVNMLPNEDQNFDELASEAGNSIIFVFNNMSTNDGQA